MIEPRVFLCCLTAVAFANSTCADDWPQWGGPRRDLVWRESGIVDRLPAVDPATGLLPRVWAATIGSGYAGPAVADGRVFVADRIAEENLERVLCFDAETGQEIWKHPYESRYTISYPLGPRATPTVDGDRVYTLGAMGHLFCFDAASGDVVWEKYLPSDFGTEVPNWGMAGAPLVDGEQLIVLAGGKPGAMVVSFDKRTGAERWRALEGKEPGYCAPVILDIAGRRQLIIWHPAAVVGLDPATGAVLWEQPFAVQAGMTIATPRTVGNRLFVTGFYSGPLMIDLGPNGNSPGVLWRTKAGNNERKNDSLHAVMCTPIVSEKYVYGVGSYGDLRCLDADTGRIVWETREPTGNDRWWNAFLVPHGDRVVICNEQGDIIFAKLTPDGYQELSRAKMIEPTQPIQRRMTVWSHPAFAMRSVFARNDGELIRVNLAAK
jgi:outer membrane protein assembly factor BamB